MPGTNPMTASYGVVVPVKPPAIAKSRLAALGDVPRRQLGAAFAIDTITAVAECPMVAAVLVVTDDVGFATVLTELGVRVIPDGASDDLNASLVQGAAELHRTHPSLRLAAALDDLPMLRPDELAEALQAADDERMSFVADAGGTGTTTVVAPTIQTFRPRFGAGSRKAHLEAGAHEILVAVPGLRQDVDTPDDLARALRRGVGSRTSLVATSLQL